MSCTVRTFSPADTEGIFDLILPIQMQEFGIAITRDDQPDLSRIHEFYQSGHGNFWVATDHTRIIGTIALLDIGNRQLALRKMFVHQQYRGGGTGVATTLLDKALLWSKAHETVDIFLGTTEKFLSAHRFYEKHGFNEIEPATLPDSFPRMAVDTKFYRYQI